MIIHRKINLEGSPGRMFVVGDLHGAFDPLIEALRAVSFDRQQDHLFSVGDLIDRGPKSLELLRLFESEPNLHAVRGNHEEMVLEREMHMHQANGGRWYWEIPVTEQDEVDAIIGGMPLIMTVVSPSGRKIGIVHADVAGTDWDSFVGGLEQDFPDFQAHAQWSRLGIGQAKAEGRARIKGVDMVYMGHTPNGAPVGSGNCRWIDTGAYFNEKVYLEQVA